MKNFAKNSIVQKILIVIVMITILFASMFTPKAYAAGDDWGIGGTLAKEMLHFVVFITDAINGLLNNMMLGVGWGDINIGDNSKNPNLTDGWINADGEDPNIVLKEGEMTNVFGRDDLEIPNILYCPENIFANNIAALDINFLNPNSYSSVVREGSSDAVSSAENKQQSAARNLSQTIASWYKSFRNISVVGLLSVLIYIGIRILISSTATDKAKYKESLKDWLTALCLIFVIHLIMSGVLMLTSKINELFAQNINNGIVVQSPDLSTGQFRTNLMGYIRFRTQSADVAQVAGYTVMYVALVIYTVMFTIMYFKRFLYMGFFTMIAPLVALTYPLDKLGDGKSQAFNMWFKEYTMNAIIQPIHLILYTVFVSSAISFTDGSGFNIIYALVAIGFMLPAEKFIKEMFGLNKAKSTSSMESFAGGALAMKGLDKIASMGSRKKGKAQGKGGEEVSEGNSGNIKFANTDGYGKLNYVNADNDSTDGNGQNMIAAGLGTLMSAEHGNNINNNENMQNDSNYGTQQNSGIMLAGASAAQDSKVADHNNNATPATKDLNDNIDSNSENNSFGKSAMNFAKLKYNRNMKGKVSKKIIGASSKVARYTGKALGTTTGATIGIAAGITSGDFSKVFSYGAAGAIAGNTIGGKAGNLVEGAGNGIAKGYNNTKNFAQTQRFDYIEATQGRKAADEARDRAMNQQKAKAFMNNKEERQKWETFQAKNSITSSSDDVMREVVKAKQAGLDDSIIENVLKQEQKRDGKIGGNSSNQLIDVAAFANKNGFDKTYIENDKKRNQLENVLEAQVGNEKGYEVGKTLASLYDREKLYSNKSNLNPENKIKLAESTPKPPPMPPKRGPKGRTIPKNHK